MPPKGINKGQDTAPQWPTGVKSGCPRGIKRSFILRWKHFELAPGNRIFLWLLNNRSSKPSSNLLAPLVLLQVLIPKTLGSLIEMQLQARPLAGTPVGNTCLEITRVNVAQRVAVALPRRAQRGPVAIQAAENTGLTSNSSLLGPSLSTGTSSLGGLKSSAAAKPTISVVDVPLESQVSKNSQ